MIWMVFYGSQKGRRKELQKDLNNGSTFILFIELLFCYEYFSFQEFFLRL